MTRAAGEGPAPGPADPQALTRAVGEAALVLAEVILMALIEGGVLSQDQVSDAMETVIDAKRPMAQEEQHPVLSQAALGILSKVGNSLAALK